MPCCVSKGGLCHSLLRSPVPLAPCTAQELCDAYKQIEDKYEARAYKVHMGHIKEPKEWLEGEGFTQALVTPASIMLILARLSKKVRWAFGGGRLMRHTSSLARL